MSSNESKQSAPSERRSWETPELIGTQLDGRYTLSEQIGSGGQAKVFKAQDKDGNTVAIKVFDFRKPLNNCIIFNHDIAQIRSPCPIGERGRGLVAN